MTIRLENGAQIIERLKKNGQCVVIEDKDAFARRQRLNKQMREIKRDLIRKLHLSRISASKVVLNA